MPCPRRNKCFLPESGRGTSPTATCQSRTSPAGTHEWLRESEMPATDFKRIAPVKLRDILQPMLLKERLVPKPRQHLRRHIALLRGNSFDRREVEMIVVFMTDKDDIDMGRLSSFTPTLVTRR